MGWFVILRIWKETEMLARMKDNLIEKYHKALPGELGAQTDTEIEDFLNIIQGEIVELKFTGPDAFEKNDDNIWLPNELWDAI